MLGWIPPIFNFELWPLQAEPPEDQTWAPEVPVACCQKVRTCFRAFPAISELSELPFHPNVTLNRLMPEDVDLPVAAVPFCCVHARELGARASRACREAFIIPPEKGVSTCAPPWTGLEVACAFACLRLSVTVSSLGYAIVSACVPCMRAGGTALLPNATRWPNLGADTARNLPSSRRRRVDGSDVGVERCVPNRSPARIT